MIKPIPQGYKQTKVGVIPEDWKVVKLGDVAKIITGSTPSTYDPKNYGDDYMFVSPSDIGRSKYINQTQKMVSKKGFLSARSIRKGSVMFVCIGSTIGKIAIAPQELITNQQINSIYSLVANNEYLYYILKKYNIKIKLLSGEQAVPIINKLEFSKTLIPIPSIKEQVKIAEILTIWDDAIAKQEQLIKQKQLLKKGLMQQIFSQKLRFKDDNGNNYPVWETKKLGELDIFISDGNYGEMYPKSSEMKSCGVPFIRANNIKNLCLIWNDMRFIDHDLHAILKSGHLKTNDILVTTRGDIGMLGYVTEEFNGSNINAQICLLRVLKNISSKFLLQFLSSNFGVLQFKALQTGSALKQLPKGNLAKVKIKLPWLPEQTKIANFLTTLDDGITNLTEQLKQLQLQKKGLMQQLLTGKVRVKV